MTRLALIGVAVAAGFVLAGCGRKGPLDPPPTALAQPQAPTPRPSLGEESDSLNPSLSTDQPRPQRAAAATPPPGAPPQPPKNFFLDFLVGSPPADKTTR